MKTLISCKENQQRSKMDRFIFRNGNKSAPFRPNPLSLRSGKKTAVTTMTEGWYYEGEVDKIATF